MATNRQYGFVNATASHKIYPALRHPHVLPQKHHGRGFGSIGRGGGGVGVREKAGCSVSVSDFGKKSGPYQRGSSTGGGVPCHRPSRHARTAGFSHPLARFFVPR